MLLGNILKIMVHHSKLENSIWKVKKIYESTEIAKVTKAAWDKTYARTKGNHTTRARAADAAALAAQEKLLDSQSSMASKFPKTQMPKGKTK